ncbi:translation initiation factor IF-2 [Clostridia bacterium]|nr:translation initiation factor IF-2 [Clostridia bacterium]
MSENNEKTVKQDDEFKHIRELIAFQNDESKQANLSALLSDIRDARKRLEELVKGVREKEIAEEKRRVEEVRRLKREEERAAREEERKAREVEEAAWAAAEAADQANAVASAEIDADGKPVDGKPVETASAPVAAPDKIGAEGQYTDGKAADAAVAAPQAQAANQTQAQTQDQTQAAARPAAIVVPGREAGRGKPPEKPRRVIDLSQIEDPGRGPGASNIRSRTFNVNDTRPGAPNTRPGGAFGARPPLGAPGTRPPFGAGARTSGGAPYKAPAVLAPEKTRPMEGKKKDPSKPEEKKGSMNKRTLIRKGYVMPDADGDERMGSRKFRNKKLKPDYSFQPIVIEKAIITTENLTVKILSEKIGKTANEIIKQLMTLGIMSNINSVVDFPTMELVASELGVAIELRLDKTKEEQLADIHKVETDDSGDRIKRPPIVAVMGHVDHGKTSLLDAIRKTSVAAGEAGGITQHIGAYTVMSGKERITFIDTPGHEAFTAMRARGARVTDVAIIVVAADDGVMPQTVEAVNHVKAAGVPIIVAINKTDKPQADIDRIKQQLSEHNVIPEEWGGDTIMAPVSAKTGAGLDKLLESVLLVAEVQEFKADPARRAQGTIIEAQLDKGRGPVATVIVQDGTLRVGDTVVAGMAAGRVRALLDENGDSIKEAGPSTPVVVLGFTEVPNAGDLLHVVADTEFSRQLADERRDKLKAGQVQITQKVTLEEMLERTGGAAASKVLNVIVKADMQGSVEAIKAALAKLPQDEVKLAVVHGAVGAVNKSDVMLADAAKARILAFNVKADNEAKSLSESGGISVKAYKIIYELIDDVTAALKGMIAPVYAERIDGHAEVRNLFNITGVGAVAGSYVLDGTIKRGAKARVKRGGDIAFEGEVRGLKRFKDDAKEVAAGFECGISIEGFGDFKEGDIIEAYTLERKN